MDLWQQFTMSGKISDYLNYKQQEQNCADDDQGTDNKGTDDRGE